MYPAHKSVTLPERYLHLVTLAITELEYRFLEGVELHGLLDQQLQASICCSTSLTGCSSCLKGWNASFYRWFTPLRRKNRCLTSTRLNAWGWNRDDRKGWKKGWSRASGSLTITLCWCCWL